MIWRDLLGRVGISARDNFFELCEHSLTATRLVARIRDEFSIEIPLRRIFDEPTLDRLAALIDSVTFAAGKFDAKPAPSAWSEDVRRARRREQLERQLRALPDEQVQRLLQEKRGAVSSNLG